MDGVSNEISNSNYDFFRISNGNRKPEPSTVGRRNSFRVFEEIFFRFTSTNLYLLVSNLNVFDIETTDNGQMNKNFK